MPVQAFVDDSGGKGQGRHFVLAGLLADAEGWAEFSDEWRACLDAAPRIQQFKMRQAASCTGAFHGVSEPQRDEKLRVLARIINRYANVCIYSAIDLHAHADTWAVELRKPFSEPYFFPFQNMILASCFELWDLGCRERFDIIFDEHVIFQPRVKLWYPAMRELTQIREPEAYSILPIDLLFRKDDEFLPIQACDMFAWCLRKGSDIGPIGDRPFEWLLEEMPSVRLSDYRQYYDRERLESVVKLAKAEQAKLDAGDDTYAEWANKYHDLFTKRRV